MTRTAFPSQRVGAFTVIAISDGTLTVSLEQLLGMDLDQATAIQSRAGIREANVLNINCYLIQMGNRMVLVDAGAGGFKQWGGELKTRLRGVGVDPAEIDTVLLTHAHPDHVGGLLDETGSRVFVNAELWAHQNEIAFWTDDEMRDAASERARRNFELARRAFTAYGTSLHSFVEGDLFPGLAAVALPGHTKGHTGFLIDSEGEQLLIWGDIVHFPQVQTSHPEVSITLDTDPVQAADTRQRLLEVVSRKQIMVAGSHLSDRGFAIVKKVDNHFHIKNVAE